MAATSSTTGIEPAAQVVDQETTAARISIHVFEAAFVNTALRRKAVEGSHSELTERCVTRQQFDSSGFHRKTKWNRNAGTQRHCRNNTTRIIDGVTATFT